VKEKLRGHEKYEENMEKRRIGRIILKSLLFFGVLSHVILLNAADDSLNEGIKTLIKNAPSSQDFPAVPAAYLLIDERDFTNADGTGNYTIHTVWKMLDRQAVPMGEISIPFDSSDSTLDIILARTIRPNGTVVNVALGDIREVTPYSSFPLYSDMKLKQFSMPAMEVGSVIEYKAVLKVLKPKIPGLFYSYWSFPPGVPVISSALEINIPEGVAADYAIRNLESKPEILKENGRVIYRWTAKDIFIEGIFEPFLPPYDTVCPNLIFATVKKWDDLSNWFYGISETQLEPNQEMKDLVGGVIKKNEGDREKITRELYYFVSKNIRYVSIPLKASSFQPHKAVDIYTNKYGDCKDKSALLISLLRIAGIDAHFALLKNRSAGPLTKKFPVNDFDHCVVAVPKKEGGYLFLDTSLELNRYSHIPYDMQDVDIFVVKKDGYEFVKLPIDAKNLSGSSGDTDMKINDDHTIDVTEKDIYFGDAEISARLNAKYSTKDATQAYFERKLKTMYTKGSLISIDFSDPDNLDEPFSLNIRYKVADHIREAGNLLIFDITSGTFPTTAISEKRRYPIWLPELSKDTFTITITTPGNTKINYLPSNVEKDTPFGRYWREVKSSGNKIVISYGFETKMLEIPVDQYDKYKDFVEYTAKSAKENIILEKTDKDKEDTT